MMNAEDMLTFLPILRGTLASPSGDEDNPWQRVILSPAGDDANPTLVLDVPTGTDDEMRAALDAAFGKSRPRHIELKDLGVFESSTDSSPGLLSNRVALVTGAAGAIGAGICRGLLEAGCRVAATDLRQDALDGLVADLASLAGDRIRGVVADVTSRASLRAALGTIVSWWGGIDIAISNAGLAHVAGPGGHGARGLSAP